MPDACDALAWFYVWKIFLLTLVIAYPCIQTDNLISGPGSLVPFSKAECEELLRRVKEFERESRIISAGL